MTILPIQSIVAMARRWCRSPFAFALTCFLLASLVYSESSVTPGDANPLCLNDPNRASVPDRQKVVLDTQDYREEELIDIDGGEDKWISANFDGIETSGANYNVS